MPMRKTLKNTLTKKKNNGLLEYMFLKKIELVGLSISLVLATFISGIYIYFNQLDQTKNAEMASHKTLTNGEKYDE